MILREWAFLDGGYLACWNRGLKFMQRFKRAGAAALGTEKETIFRLEFSLRPDQHMSFFNLEIMNPTEARVVYLWLRLSRRMVFVFILNVGARLTSKSREYRAQEAARVLKNRAVNNISARFQEMKLRQKTQPKRVNLAVK